MHGRGGIEVVVNRCTASVGLHGHRDVAAKVPVANNTVLRIASMTKSTAIAVFKLRY